MVSRLKAVRTRMSEPPRKKLRQSSLLDLFGRKKTQTLQLETDSSVNTEEDSCVVINDSESEDMGDREEQRAKTAAAADRRRKENAVASPNKDKQAVNRPTTTLDKKRKTDGPRSPKVAFKEESPSKELHSQMASATIQYSASLSESLEPQLTEDSSQASMNSQDYTDLQTTSRLRAMDGDQAVSGKTKSSSAHNGKKKIEKSPIKFNIPDNKPLLSTICSKGTPIDQLKRSPACSPKYPPQALKTSLRHIVLIKTPVTPGVVPKPSYQSFVDEWSGSHVRMPCSPENLYPVDGPQGRKELRARWELIEAALLTLVGSKTTTSRDLEKAILSYNSRYSNKWDFSGLHEFFSEHLEEVESDEFFRNTLPAMVELALQMPYVCTQPIPLLKAQEEHAVTLSQQQVACLLANAFFCTFPRRNARQKHSEYSSFPGINFNDLFQGSRSSGNCRKAGKLKCLINYFRRVTKSMPTGTVTYYRQVERFTDFPLWAKSEAKLTKLHITANGTIEDDGEGMLQVDFANKYIGGGVLGYGCVQEEIRFIICPEMILSRLFTECLDANECLIMTGCERYSNYDGYANSFEWTGDHHDNIPRDSWGRRYTQVVAIDALAFRSSSTAQFCPDDVRRELNKAFCGFLDRQTAVSQMQAVATGNWGCGAFGGDLLLKVLIQLMAASAVKREICYFTFGDSELVESVFQMYEFLKEKDVTLGTIWNLVNQYYTDVCYSGASKTPKMNLFEYIYKVYTDYDDSTDDGCSPVRINSQELWDSEPNMDEIEGIVAEVERKEKAQEMNAS